MPDREKIMADAVSFWLDNKMSSGIKAAEIGSQVLVLYRERYYLIEDGAALTKGGRTIRYGKSTLPTVWKKALRGIMPPAPDPSSEAEPEEGGMPRPTRTKKERTQVTTPATAAAPTAAEISVPAAKTSAKALKPRKKPEVKPAFQSSVTALCPYCSHKHELPVEKGKNGKAFILVCDRCNTDFAVRFVQVVQYQAQTAGFR